MKKKLYLITTLILSVAVLSLSSCLKDPRAQDFSNVGTLVELPLEAYTGVGKLVPEALPIQTTPQNIPVVINIASPKPLSSALTVTLAVDNNALTAYNHANGLDTGGNVPYTLPPANSYAISSLKVTIPAGQHTATLNVAITSSNLDPSGLYVIPISIVDGGGQKISNYKTVLLNVQAKNKYDGAYTATGTFTDTAAPTITAAGIYPYDIYLVTQSATSVAFEDPSNGFYHLINSGGTNSIYGEFAPVFNFDPTTNVITSVVNYYGQPSPGRVRAARIDVTGVNALTGTPGTAGSVIKVKYVMTQGGADRTFFDETYTYTGTRP
jgi:hypothetical protein